MPLPTLTPAQRAAALEKAAQTRTARAQARAQLRPASSAPSTSSAPRPTHPPATCASSSCWSRSPASARPGRRHCSPSPASRPPGGCGPWAPGSSRPSPSCCTPSTGRPLQPAVGAGWPCGCFRRAGPARVHRRITTDQLKRTERATQRPRSSGRLDDQDCGAQRRRHFPGWRRLLRPEVAHAVDSCSWGGLPGEGAQDLGEAFRFLDEGRVAAALEDREL